MTDLNNQPSTVGTVWYLIDARLPTSGRDLAAWATCTTKAPDSPSRQLPLSVSRKGRVFELLPSPPGEAEPTIRALSGGEQLPLLSLDIRKVSVLRAWYLMLRRLFSMFPKLAEVQRRGLGLSWKNILLDTYNSYRQISKLRAHYPAPSYSAWQAEYWQLTPQQRKRLSHRIQTLRARKLQMVVVIDLRKTNHAQINDRAIESVRTQYELSVPIWLLVSPEQHTSLASLADRSEITQLTEAELVSAVEADNQLVVWMTPAVVLAPWALAWLKCEAVANPGQVLFYTDHDQVLPDGSLGDPQFKPDWSLELARCSAYLGDLLMIRGSALRHIAHHDGLSSVYRLALDAGCQWASQIHHIPAVLWHSTGPTSAPTVEELTAHLAHFKVRGSVQPDKRQHLRVKYELPLPAPKISVIIPTRDMLHFLRPCVDSLLNKTSWPNIEVLMVDNQSTCPKTLAYMQQIQADTRVRLLHYDQPFNFSAINNFAVEHAEGELICLLNNDTEVISPDWLEEMASRLLQPRVGIVGARLYFSDGRVQHAGDVIGPGGCANHLHGIIDADDPGYMNRAILPQDLSAVTAACLLTRRDLFLQLGGLNATNLPVGFNDVDYCLRVREAGYRVIYTPYAELYHHESVSRGKDNSAAKRARAKREADYLRQRWPRVIERDPYYNPNLNYSQPDFTLGKFPRITWPW